ncbi:MAG: hypothetical protein EON51_12510 [Acinetobacter sp.]|nr:MAG: hypothetical protein EON51_12510 [Acinetobacter sp.]
MYCHSNGRECTHSQLWLCVLRMELDHGTSTNG